MGAPGFGSEDSAEMSGAGRGFGAVGQGGVRGLLKGKRGPSQALKEDETSAVMGRCVVKSKLSLLAVCQASKSKRQSVEARDTTSFRESADRKDGRLLSQNNHLMGSECQVLS